ncbi:hypothetical protein B0H17DRAFT_1142013 [Mycena rosella]|uniref:Uncharacterized protein n=1 Tax=Mycena rosella TaxID=1033263 RepID=A0AAD7G8F2_MYCRO|nr:hypothetical protein B0H17DRAFT_1142013 [Mycena rosella]
MGSTDLVLSARILLIFFPIAALLLGISIDWTRRSFERPDTLIVAPSPTNWDPEEHQQAYHQPDPDADSDDSGGGYCNPLSGIERSWEREARAVYLWITAHCWLASQLQDGVSGHSMQLSLWRGRRMSSLMRRGNGSQYGAGRKGRAQGAEGEGRKSGRQDGRPLKVPVVDAEFIYKELRDGYGPSKNWYSLDQETVRDGKKTAVNRQLTGRSRSAQDLDVGRELKLGDSLKVPCILINSSSEV